MTKLNQEDFEGIDVSIEISLKDYGIAWKDNGSEYLVYYGVESNDAEYIKFDWAFVSKDIDVRSEYDWADFEGMESFGSFDDDMDLMFKIDCLLRQHGYENVFGTCYHGGKTFDEIFEDE